MSPIDHLLIPNHSKSFEILNEKPGTVPALRVRNEEARMVTSKEDREWLIFFSEAQMELNLKEHQDWMLENKKLQNAKTTVVIFGPVLMIMFLFFTNVIHLDPQRLAPPPAKAEISKTEDPFKKTWYSELLPKRNYARSIAMKK